MNTTTEIKSANPAVPEGYLTKHDLALRFKKSVRTIENWQRRGILPFMKCERSVLFKWSEVETHIQRNYSICRITITKSE
jgi:hypothetical protein